jgi:hypothetical protein
MEKTVPPVVQVAPEDELPVRVQEALGELAAAAREGLLALSVGVGLGVLAAERRGRDDAALSIEVELDAGDLDRAYRQPRGTPKGRSSETFRPDPREQAAPRSEPVAGRLTVVGLPPRLPG